MPVMPTLPTYKCCNVNSLVFVILHGMEEVIGSIPIRSTNYFNNLDRTFGNCGAFPGTVWEHSIVDPSEKLSWAFG